MSTRKYSECINSGGEANECEQAQTTYLNERLTRGYERVSLFARARSLGSQPALRQNIASSRVLPATPRRAGRDEVIAIRVCRAITPGPGL